MMYTYNMHSSELLPASDTPKQVAIAASLLPWRKDDLRSKYFSYIACGFTAEESLYMIGLGFEWLERQREDDTFATFELRIPEIRKELSKEYIELDFFRNFRMVLEKDYRTLRKALDMERDATGEIVPISKYEQQYLLKMRAAYTPQQLQILGQVMSGVGAENFNFAKWIAENQEVVKYSRTDSVEVKRRLLNHETESDLQSD